MIGALRSLREAVDDDLLVTIDALITAEALGDLIEQAEYLLNEGFFLAAGVLGRAVLEEHLRKWCGRLGCMPTTGASSLNKFNAALYDAQAITKTEMMHVQAMAAVGNDAAHNTPTLKRDDVERMIPDARTFLAQHPLP